MHPTRFALLTLLSLAILGIGAPGRAAAANAGSGSLLPFPVDPSTMAHLHGYIGQSCDLLFSSQQDIWTGFSPIPDFATITTPGGIVHPMMKDQSRFAFLVTSSGNACRISDVVVLPDPVTANVFEECHASGSEGADGFAMRSLGEKKLVAWWSIDPQAHTMVRKPVESREKLRCQEPAGGE